MEDLSPEVTGQEGELAQDQGVECAEQEDEEQGRVQEGD